MEHYSVKVGVTGRNFGQKPRKMFLTYKAKYQETFVHMHLQFMRVLPHLATNAVVDYERCSFMYVSTKNAIF